MNTRTTPVLTLRGFIDGLQGRQLIGWAWLPDHPTAQLDLEVVENDTVLAEGTADLFRQDLTAAGIGDGRHAYRIELPASLFDDEEHELTVREKASGMPICAALTLPCPREALGGGALVAAHRAPGLSDGTGPGTDAWYEGPTGGHLDTSDGSAVHGWAWLPDRPMVRVDVEILDDAGEVVARGRAARFRPDLVENGVGDGFHAFVVSVPAHRMRHGELIVTARIAGVRDDLPGDPVRVCAPPQPLSLLISRARGLTFEHDVLFAPEFMIPSAAAGTTPRFPALPPSGEMNFTDDIPGDGWTRPISARGGRRIGSASEAMLRLAHLPARPTAVTLFVNGPRRAVAALEVWVDQQRLPTSTIPLPAERESALAFRLPASGPIRTLVALRFVLRGGLTERGGGGDLVFRRLLFGD